MPESDTPLKILSSRFPRVLRFLRVNHVNHQKHTPYIILRLDFLEFSGSIKSFAQKRHPFEKFELSISVIPVSQTVNQQKRTPLYMTVFSRIPRVNRKRHPFEKFGFSISTIPASQPVNQKKRKPPTSF